jgi:dynein heavy chain
MKIPSYMLMAEILLFSYRFFDAQNLARKIIALFRLSSQVLSTQVGYFNAGNMLIDCV